VFHLQPHSQTMDQSTLTLFVLWILTDNSDRTFSLNDLAFLADRFYR
jgi:hypothetical protein